MSVSNSISPPFPVFSDVDGDPLEDGYIYIGTAGLNPVTNPIQVYSDKALSVPVAQPIRTIGGYPVSAGAVIRLNVNAADYSTLVRNKNSSLIYSSLNQTSAVPSGIVNFNQGASGAVDSTVYAKLREYVSVTDFGAVGDWDEGTQTGTDSTAAIQAAITYACTAQKRLLFPAGAYAISTPLTFPNTSWVIEGEGPTATSIQATVASGITSLFNLINCNGPAKVIRDISFKGPQFGNLGSASAIYNVENGLNLDNVWFRGVLRGLDCGGASFVNTINCTAESCGYAVYALLAVVQSVWTGWTFYKNNTDIYLKGSCKTLVIQGTTSIGCQFNVILFDVASDVNVIGLSVQDANPGTGWTPVLLEFTGSSQYNNITNFNVVNYGLIGIRFSTSGANNNQVSNVMLYGVPTGISFLQADFNRLSNIRITAATTYGIVFNTAAVNYVSDFTLDTCAYGVYITASNSQHLKNGVVTGSTTADFYYPTNNTALIFVEDVIADFTAVGGIQYIGSYDGLGNKVVHTAAVPAGAGVGFVVGDRAHPRIPVVGQPKGWLCTVTGAPGTWVSEGNL